MRSLITQPTIPVERTLAASAAAPEVGLPGPDEAQGLAWYIVQTKSRQEKKLAGHMRAMQIRSFLPLVSKVRIYGKRQQFADIPLFQGYVFLYGRIEQVYEVDRTRHSARFLEVPDQEKLHGELSAVHTILVGGGGLDPYPALTEGVRAEVRAGPFKGVQGLVEGRGKLNRIIFQIEILGQASSLEIDGSLLEVLD